VKPLPSGNETAGVLGAAVHLTHDLHGLARLVVEGEEKHRGIHHARSLVIESTEQLREVAGVGSKRAQATRQLEPHAKPLLARSQRVKGGSAGLDAQGFASRD